MKYKIKKWYITSKGFHTTENTDGGDDVNAAVETAITFLRESNTLGVHATASVIQTHREHDNDRPDDGNEIVVWSQSV